MASSSAAAAVIERARRIRTVATPDKLTLPKGRLPAGSSSLIAASSAEARVLGTTIRAYLGAGRPATMEVDYPVRAEQARALKLPSGAALSLAIRDTANATAEYANGYLVYRGGMLAGADMIIRPSENGFEDYFLFDKKPENRRIEYDLTLPRAVAGLRLSSNILEMVDVNGAPLVHASSPFLVDSAGKVTKAKLSVTGCAFDESTQPTWRRKPTAPGASSCRISVTWDDSSVQYPALLDPAWETAAAMPVASAFYGHAILAGRSPQQIVVFDFANNGVLQNTTLFFDVDSGTWSVGPPTVVARAGSSAVSFNNSKTNDGAQVFVSGGFSVANGQRNLESSTEILSLNATGEWAWKLSSPMHAARYGHTATAISTATGTQVLLAGGYGVGPYATGCDPGATATTAELYDTATGAFVSPAPPNLPAPLFLATAALSPDGQAVIIMSGFNGGVDQPVHYCSGSSMVLAFRGGQWLTLPGMPTYRIDPLVAQLNDGRFLVTGGGGYTDATQQTCAGKTQTDIFTFSPTPPYGSWATADPLPIASAGNLVTLSNGAVMYGPIGADTSCDTPPTPTTQVELFDPNTGHWWRTTDTALPHYSGGLASVTKSTGEHEAVVFGGATAFNSGWTYTATTETFTLAPAGGSCTVGPECATGICLGSLCQPPGFPITLDATALTNKGVSIPGVLNGAVLDSTQPRPLNLTAGTYNLQTVAGIASVATFTVKADGTIDYAPSLEGVLGGVGGTTLKVNGRTITVDATSLSQPQLALLAYHYQAGVEVDQLAFATNTKRTFTLLPLSDFGYRFDVDGNHLTAFTFNLDLSGNVLIPSDELILARGSGGSLLRLGGAHVSVTIPTGLGSAVLGGGITIPEGTTVDLQLLPYASGSTMSFTIGGQTATLTVNAAGYVDGDPLLLHILGIHGDGAPMCDAENTQAEAGGWDYTPINSCAGPSLQTATGYIDAPTINPTVTARISGAGRPPSMLPRNRRPAGGDPVLGDGEFLIDRTDVSLPGLGIHYEFHRSYRSGNQISGPLSTGWEHNYDQRILGQVVGNPQSPNFEPILFGDEIGASCDGTVQFQDGAGNVLLFKQTKWAFDNGGFIEYFAGPTSELALELHLSVFSPLSTSWRLIRNDGQVTTFDRAGFLSSITDPAGNSLTFGWARATPPAPPTGVDCPAVGYSTKECSSWLYGLTRNPIGQRRRLMFVTDQVRTIYYVYSQTNTEQISTSDRLACLSLSNDCSTQVLASFGYDSASRLATIRHGAPTVAAFETYAYHPVTSDVPYCHPNPELSAYCHNLCDAPSAGHCNNQGYEAQVAGKCGQSLCNPPGAGCDGLFEPFLIRRGTALNSPSICCTGSQVGDPTICRQFLWDGPNCVDGCENRYQCTTTVSSRETAAAYSIGVGSELSNDITDVYDNKGGLVVHNVYGEDRNVISFDKVTSQTLGSASKDNTITFEYHDLSLELLLPDGPPVFNDVTHYVNWAPAYGTYSAPDPDVNQNVRPRNRVLEICPATCAGGGTCATPDYGPPVEEIAGADSRPMVFATVIHDLHGLKRIQYLDPEFYVMKEVTLNTGDVTEFNYTGGGIIPGGLLRGVLAPSGVRTCLERDAGGRVTQSSLVAAPNHPDGNNTTQATTYAYYANGQLSDEVHDIFGRPTRTHYDRDAASRVTRIDQDVDNGVQVHTIFAYDGETPPAGVLETPTSITYPNLRQDRFSQFDASLGGPRSTIIDATSPTPEKRYAVYDQFGRVTEMGEIGRYAERFGFADSADIGRLTSTGHRLDSTKPWVDKTIASHVVDGTTVVDSIVEPTRTTNFTTVGAFATEKDLVATVAPTGSTLPTTQTSCYNYAPDGRLDAMILPEGNGVTYTYKYQPTGNIVLADKGFSNIDTSGTWAAGCRGRTAPPNDPGPSRTATFYQPGGFVSGEIDANMVGRTYTTDGFGRVISIASVQNPAHSDPVATQQFGYDAAGHRIWRAERTPGTAYRKPTLPDASVLSYSEIDYDLSGRVKHERASVLETGEVLVTSYAYDDVGGAMTVTDRGAVTKTVLDGRGRLLSSTQPDTSVKSVVHGLGVDTTTIQSNSHGKIVRVYNYDTRGLLMSVATSTGQSLYSASYDDDSNQMTETRAGVGPVTWVYDSFNRMVSQTHTIATTPSAVSASSVYQYDRNDRVTKYYDAENSPSAGGVPWIMTFSGADAPLTITDPLRRAGVYTYSTDPNWPHTLVATVQEPSGRTTSFGYDSQARLLDLYNGPCGTTRDWWTCTTPLTTKRHMTYDLRGKVSQVDGPSPRPSVSFTYDSLGRVVNEQVGVDSLVHNSYLDQGRSIQAQVSYGTAMATMTHRYDAMGRLQTVELAGQSTPLATYGFGTGVGGPLTLAYSNGATATYSYDDKLRQTGIDVTFKKPGQQTPTFLASLHEAFGADSIPRLRQHRVGTQSPTTDVFQVDLEGRISGENLRQTGILLPSGEISNSDPLVASNIQKGTQWRAYDLDTLGNIKQRRMKTSTLVHTVDKLGRITALGGVTIPSAPYDNMVGKQGDPVQFAFDAFSGTVASARVGTATTTYVYDALNRRHSEHRSADNSDHIYVWDGNKLVGHGTPTDVALDVPGTDIDAHVVTIDQMGAGSQWFYHQGQDESTFAVTGSAGLVETYAYSAFGELTIFNGNGNAISKSAFGNIFQYQGQLFDAPTATYSMRARQYQPAWGTFLSPDPIGTLGGPSMYAFTGSRPLAARDPLGLLPDDAKWVRGWMASWDSPFAAPWDPSLALASGLPDLESREKYTFYYDEYGEIHAREYLGGWNDVDSRWWPGGVCNVSCQAPEGRYIEHYRDTVIGDIDLTAPPSAASRTTYPSMDAAFAASAERLRMRAEWDADSFGRLLRSVNKELLEPLALAPIVAGGVRVVQEGEALLEELEASAPTLANLHAQLSLEEATTAFTETGELSSTTIENSKLIIENERLGNPEIPADFAKYSTETLHSPSGPFEVHFYMNPTTGEVFYGNDYKAIFQHGGDFEGWGAH